MHEGWKQNKKVHRVWHIVPLPEDMTSHHRNNKGWDGGGDLRGGQRSGSEMEKGGCFRGGWTTGRRMKNSVHGLFVWSDHSFNRLTFTSKFHVHYCETRKTTKTAQITASSILLLLMLFFFVYVVEYHVQMTSLSTGLRHFLVTTVGANATL